MKKIYLLFVLSSFSQLLFAQNFIIEGKVSDNQNQAIPFATVFVKGTTIGTSANKDGFFTLKLTSGSKDLIFSAVGFKQLIKPTFINQDLTINVSLSPEIFELKDVIVKSGGEDPAYDIIRKAIKERKNYLNQKSAYTCDVYIKGIQRLLKAPEKFFGRDVGTVTSEIGLDSNRTGIIYQSESQSILSYLPPKNYREEMISSKVAGGNRSFSFNRATDLLLNFYENFQEWDGLSNRPFISPIADNALFYYNYKLIGSTVENGELINKIELLPKRGYDPAYRGFIYIVEDNKINQVVTKKFLENHGFICTVVENGYEAIELVKETLFDIILMDINMPLINGFETSKLMRQNGLSKCLKITSSETLSLFHCT